MKRTTLILYLFWSVLAAPPLAAQKKIVLTTYNSQITDAIVASIAPDINWGKEPHLYPYTWTQGGIVNITRPLIRFDLAAIPAGAKIEEALLVLHYDPSTPSFGYHAGATSFAIRRVTGPWEELKATWINQPATTDAHQVIVPPATFNQQNYIVDVTALVQDIQNAGPAGNYGFMLRLLDETPYNWVRIAGTDHADPSRHPQLWLTVSEGFTDPGGGCRFRIGPNPTAGELTVSSQTVPAGNYTATVFDVQGKMVHTQALTGSYSLVYLQHLPAAVYVLQISDAQGSCVQTEKIAVQR